MVSRQQPQSKIGYSDGEASSKTDDTTLFPKGLPEDLEKLRSALLSDMTQVVGETFDCKDLICNWMSEPPGCRLQHNII